MRYLRLLVVQLRNSLVLAAQYRWDFILDGLLSLFWAFVAIVPLLAVYAPGRVAAIPGWTLPQGLVVTGWFIILQGVLEGAINPSLQNVVENIRKGTLDFILMKPADAQFLVSTSRFNPWRIITVGCGVGIFVYAFVQMGTRPAPSHVLAATILFGCAVVLLYSLWILVISAAFYVVKVDNLTFLFSSIFDVGRWPATVFGGALRFFFTFVIPVAVMTTFPAEALLGRIDPIDLPLTFLGTVVFFAATRRVWTGALARYTSAGG